MELWDILNVEGKPTGRTVVRGGTSLRSGEYHLVVHIWPFNDYGSILIQKRTKTKRLMPGMWAATGGAAIAGETSLKAAARELGEELGIRVKDNELKFVKRIKRRNSFVDIWAVNVNVRVPELRLQKSEVAEAKWVNKATLSAMIESGDFHDYGRDYFDLVYGLSEEIKNKKIMEEKSEKIK